MRELHLLSISGMAWFIHANGPKINFTRKKKLTQRDTEHAKWENQQYFRNNNNIYFNIAILVLSSFSSDFLNNIIEFYERFGREKRKNASMLNVSKHSERDWDTNIRLFWENQKRKQSFIALHAWSDCKE